MGLITKNPILVNPLTADRMILDMMNGKRFKVRSLTGRSYDISEIFSGKMMLITINLKFKNSE